MPLVRSLALASLVLLAAGSVGAQSTFLTLDSQPGDWVGAGLPQTFTTLDGTFTTSTNFDGGVSVNLSGPSHFWRLDFAPVAGATLGTGAYVGAERFPFQAPSRPGLSVSGDGRGCNRLTGRFVVLELVKDGAGTITSFAADFEQHCEGGTPALFGSIRIQSSVTAEPRLAAGGARVLEGDVGLTDSSFEVFLTKPAAVPVTVDYHSVQGTAVAGADYLPVQGALALTPGELEVLVPVLVRTNTSAEADRSFGLSLTNASGVPLASGASDALALVLDDDDGKTRLYLDSTAFDFVGQSARKSFDELDGTFSGTLTGSVAHLSFDGSDSWTLEFAAPSGSPLLPGTYTGATRYPFHPPGTPGLSVSGEGRGCNQLTGSFTVLEIELGAGTTLARFAADFVQRCENGSSALFGSIRLNSSLPVTQQAPVAGDLDRDGWPDLTWRHQGTGFDVVQFLDGIVDAGFASLPTVADPAWTIAATNDWNNDGKTDQLWRHGISGVTLVLFLDGVSPTGFARLPTVPVAWRIVGTSRFDVNVSPDILWRNETSGQNGIAFLQGTTVLSFQLIEPEPDPDWTVVAAADFDRNGRADVLWHHRTTHANRVWFMNGTFHAGTAALQPGEPDWEPVAVADLDRNGQSDLLWRNRVTGLGGVWFLRGHRRSGMAELPILGDLDWRIVGPK
jgi:Calx-beta domain-containing protein